MFFRKLSQTGKFMPLVLIALSGALFLQTAAPVQAEEVRRFFIKIWTTNVLTPEIKKAARL